MYIIMNYECKMYADIQQINTIVTSHRKSVIFLNVILLLYCRWYSCLNLMPES